MDNRKQFIEEEEEGEKVLVLKKDDKQNKANINYGSILETKSSLSKGGVVKLINESKNQNNNNNRKIFYETSGYDTQDSKKSVNNYYKANSISSLNSSFEKISTSTSITTGGDGSRENIIPLNDTKEKDEGENDENSLLFKGAKKIPCLGIIFALCASIFLGSAGMLVKMTTSVHGVQVAIFRKISWKPDKDEFKPVLSRALLGGMSITFSYFALKLIPLGDATTIRFSMPIWSLIVGYLILNESCSLLKILAVITCIGGVFLIAKPDFCINVILLIYYFIIEKYKSLIGIQQQQQQQLNSLEFNSANYNNLSSPFFPADSEFLLINETDKYNFNEKNVNENYKQFEGSLLALSSSICLSLSLVALRLCKKTQVEITILWLSIASILIGSILLITINQWRMPDNFLDYLYILLNGLCGSIGQWFITSSLKIEQSGVISLARTADIQVAFLYSALLLHEPIRMTSVVGSILVSCGVLAVAIPKWLSNEESVENNNNNSNGNGNGNRNEKCCFCCCFFRPNNNSLTSSATTTASFR